MSIMKLISFLIAILVILGILFSLIGDLLNTFSQTDSGQDNSQVYPVVDPDKTGRDLDDKNQNLFWFVQISDLHISKFKDFQRAPDLIKFCENHLKVIKPELVIVSGDLVDAKLPDLVSSTQFLEEWVEYKKVLDICAKQTTAKWLDIRGNHDAFDVPDLDDSKNLYREYSKQGVHHKTSYSYTHTTKYGNYKFIGVDACPDPGPRRPFNFFGQLSTERQNELIKLASDDDDQKSNLTIWFGHYPTGFIVQDPPGIKHVMRNGIVYLCGHLHTLNGLVPEMYTKQKTGMLELELGDWRDNRLYRILAVDNDILSFVDVGIYDWPVILITNPKHAQFQTSTHEPLHLVSTSTHIRFLVFSEGEVVSASVSIDGLQMGSAKHINGPLFTLHWDPSKYSTGSHIISIVVKDSLNKEKEIHQPFSLDGTRPDYKFVSRFLLMINISIGGKILFGSIVFILTLFLTSLRQCADIRKYFLQGESYICTLFNKWLYKLWLTSRTNFSYKATIYFILYVTFGPWFIGDLLNDHTGCVFVWGIFLKNTFIPGSDTYFYGVFQIVTFNIPLLLLSSHILDIRSRAQSRKNIQYMQYIQHYILIIPMVLLLIFQCFLALREFPRAYGTKALVLGPVRTGSIFYALFVYYKSHVVYVNDGKTQSCSSSYS